MLCPTNIFLGYTELEVFTSLKYSTSECEQKLNGNYPTFEEYTCKIFKRKPQPELMQ